MWPIEVLQSGIPAYPVLTSYLVWESAAGMDKLKWKFCLLCVSFQKYAAEVPQAQGFAFGILHLLIFLTCRKGEIREQETNVVKVGMIFSTCHSGVQLHLPIRNSSDKKWEGAGVCLGFTGDFKRTTFYYLTAFHWMEMFMMRLIGCRLPYAIKEMTTKKNKTKKMTAVLCHLQHSQ